MLNFIDFMFIFGGLSKLNYTVCIVRLEDYAELSIVSSVAFSKTITVLKTVHKIKLYYWCCGYVIFHFLL